MAAATCMQKRKTAGVGSADPGGWVSSSTNDYGAGFSLSFAVLTWALLSEAL
jgi:hypothetical protein